MLSNGISEDDLFSFLSLHKKEDLDHRYILSSMCTLPHPVAVRAHCMFMETNLGDPGLFPGTAALERLLVERLGTLFHHKNAGGYATSGGTESNIQALRLAKALRPGSSPNVVLPESVHFSFKKACDLLSLEMRSVPLGTDRRIMADKAAELIDKNTICLVGVAGTTEYGMVDPIADLAKIAAQQDIFLHVDAAFGGMVIPFLPKPVPFDFALPGVTTLAVDPHKMGMSTIPAGVLLTREPDMLDALNIDTPYLTVKKGYTLGGTRPGAPMAGALAVLDYLGISGMKAVVAGCMKNTERLIAGMETRGIQPAASPDVNVATFVCDRVPEPWKVSWTRAGHLRIVCMPHVTADRIEAFLSDFGDMYA
ncbi:Pyridoxal-dependent decarboxylase [Methanoregula boonei 6A8]|jgi:tyrosine decarboxylase/aspartate 1-decarboxylase|uniref:Probable L-tyrosine/L-aspartate decarboxylase n=1 Tax=Methanoregula boonei (strain DSM 21154 / JCM 14090 / 6A8) TaxID=456442 RepID=MFNA_METB6|nr:tyrosine decarboxylase MfnA [Methanoregula boonei]A7IAB9.1 RecName: Full=Probable L-tyrosine/L-aspartate decarboxylase; Short=TDC/ADC [Methanoregula boonei 6A8]ABS56680.1 Pyridoxal-dependent decarboxylase [Methanoregula boonei 6A8]